MPKIFRRYKEPARIPHIPGKIDLFQDDKRSCRTKTDIGSLVLERETKGQMWQKPKPKPKPKPKRGGRQTHSHIEKCKCSLFT
jgi:hypothetical protein